MSAAIAFPWRWLLSAPLSGAENMALDEALMLRARERDECFLRVYTWARPTLSLGRNQGARGKYDVARADALGIDIIRRPTGGRAVLHHREITYSVAAPVEATGDLRESCRALNVILLDALARMGVAAEIASPAGRARIPDTHPCFGAAVAGEIVAGGRKLVGSAQVREKGVLLQHGSVLIEDDQDLAAELALRPAAMACRPATLLEQLGRVPVATEFAEAMVAALGTLTGQAVRPLNTDAALTESAAALRLKYEGDDWTWRR